MRQREGGPVRALGWGGAMIPPTNLSWGLHRALGLCAQGREAGVELRGAERCWERMNFLVFSFFFKWREFRLSDSLFL